MGSWSSYSYEQWALYLTWESLKSCVKWASEFSSQVVKEKSQFSHSVMSILVTQWTTAFPVPHQLLELDQAHVHRVGDTSLSSVIPFSSCLQSFPISGSFPVSQFFELGGQSIRVSASASVLPMNIQNWFPLGSTGLIYLFSHISQGFLLWIGKDDNRNYIQVYKKNNKNINSMIFKITMAKTLVLMTMIIIYSISYLWLCFRYCAKPLPIFSH